MLHLRSRLPREKPAQIAPPSLSAHPPPGIPQCLTAGRTTMSDEPHAATPPPEQPAREPEPAIAAAPSPDTSRGVTRTADNPAAAAEEGPNDAPRSHETGASPPPPGHHADAAGGPTAQPVVPGLPFVAPSSYLRPLVSSRAQSQSPASGGGNEARTGSLAAGRQMAVRKASNPVDREQIEGLVSDDPLFLAGRLAASCEAEGGESMNGHG